MYIVYASYCRPKKIMLYDYNCIPIIRLKPIFRIRNTLFHFKHTRHKLETKFFLMKSIPKEFLPEKPFLPYLHLADCLIQVHPPKLD